jgi:DNA-binding LytR/AlgR family response regulator
MVRLLLSDILFIEGLGNYVKIHLINQQIVTYQSLTYFEKLLPESMFIRIHKSFIISISKIDAYSQHQIEIGKTEIPIGAIYKEVFLKKMKN